MNMQPQQVTPQMAALGSAIITAVQMVLENPKEAQAAAQAHAEAYKLNADQMQEYSEAVDLMRNAAALRKELQDQINDVDVKTAALAKGQAALEAAQKEHSANVDSLNMSQKSHDAKLNQIGTREDKLSEDEENLADAWAVFRKAEEQAKKREEMLRQREDAASEFARKLSGAAA